MHLLFKEREKRDGLIMLVVLEYRKEKMGQVLNIGLVGAEADLPVRQRTQTGIPIHRGKL